MRVKCTKCNKEFEIEYITKLINLCEDCENIDSYDLPPGFDEIFGGKK